jgi:transglutaminase-like putative cysteine protease
VAARYVSGYLFAAPPDGGADSVEVETHAWLEVLLPGGEHGAPAWVGLDPTNRSHADDRYVKIGHGRHYDDVPPIKGVYRGGDATLSASVTMTRLDPSTSARA